MKYQKIKLEIKGEVAEVALANPKVRNAMDERTLEELRSCFKSLGKAKTTRVVVLRAEGKDFCAGADIRWMRKASEYPPAKNKKDAYRLVHMLQAIDECPLPVIALISGGVYGGGLGIVAACDIVIAESDTRMCFSECRLGILPAVISSFVLPKIGISHTRRLYLTSELFGMKTARRIGLVHIVLPADKMEAKKDFFIKNILTNGPQALKLAKGYLRKMTTMTTAQRIRFSVETLMKARASKEGKEGLSAFLEKRPAAWVPVTEDSD